MLTLEFSRADRAARQSPEFYEGLIHMLLCQPAPEGFLSAIETADEFLKRFGEGNWRVWRSIACANGQRYKYLLMSEKSSTGDLEQVRTRALSAVKRVIFLNPEERESMHALWDPERATPEESDLVVFFDYPEFKAVLEPVRKKMKAILELPRFTVGNLSKVEETISRESAANSATLDRAGSEKVMAAFQAATKESSHCDDANRDGTGYQRWSDVVGFGFSFCAASNGTKER